MALLVALALSSLEWRRSGPVELLEQALDAFAKIGTGKGSEDQGLDPTGEEAEQEDRDGNRDRHETIQHAQSELIGQDVPQESKAQRQRFRELLEHVQRDQVSDGSEVLHRVQPPELAKPRVEGCVTRDQSQASSEVDVIRRRT